MFDGFGEADPKGTKAPRTKYLAKFRSLHFNLKTNPAFRSQVASNALTPGQIVGMTNEDLLTPELRKMAADVRAASLKDSMREAPTLPTAKRTHKGEEEMEGGAESALKEIQAQERELERRERVMRERRKREQQGEGTAEAVKEEGQGDKSPSGSPKEELRSPPFRAPSPTRRSPVVVDSAVAESPVTPAAKTFLSRARTSLSTSGITLSAEELGIEPTKDPKAEQSTETTRAQSVKTETNEMVSTPVQPRRSSNFDMASIWGNVKPQSPVIGSNEGTPMEVDGSAEPDQKDDQEDGDGGYDPFASISGHRTGDDDDFDNSLLRDDEDNTDKSTNKSAESTPVKPIATQAPVATAKPALPELDRVWEGDLIVPEEGGFPGWAVQVGGRCLGPESEVWRQILPRGLTTNGRMPTRTAAKYLVDCSFAPTRELVAVALLPDLAGPTAEHPHKPSADKCRAKYQHLVDVYKGRDRIGVIAPGGAMRKLVKDVYVVPLKKADPLPEYVELMDDKDLYLAREREGDLLLLVLVVQKGALPTYTKTGQTPVKVPRSPTVAAAAVPRGPSGLSAPPLNANEGGYSPVGGLPGLRHTQPQPAPTSYAALPSTLPVARADVGGYSPMPASTASRDGGYSPMPPPPVSAPSAALPALDPAALQALLKNDELQKALAALTAIPGLGPAPAPPAAPAPTAAAAYGGRSPLPLAVPKGPAGYVPSGLTPSYVPSGASPYAPQGYGYSQGYAPYASAPAPVQQQQQQQGAYAAREQGRSPAYAPGQQWPATAPAQGYDGGGGAGGASPPSGVEGGGASRGRGGAYVHPSRLAAMQGGGEGGSGGSAGQQGYAAGGGRGGGRGGYAGGGGRGGYY